MTKKFLVIMKSNKISLEGKEALLIPMEFDMAETIGVEQKVLHDAMIRDAIKLYPKYAKGKNNHTTFTIHDLSQEEYDEYARTGVYVQHSMLKE